MNKITTSTSGKRIEPGKEEEEKMTKGRVKTRECRRDERKREKYMQIMMDEEMILTVF